MNYPIKWFNRPPKGRTSLGYIIELVRKKQMHWKDGLKIGLNRFPNSTFPLPYRQKNGTLLWLEDAYWAYHALNPVQSIKSWSNRWRMVIHALQGALQTLPFGLISLALPLNLTFLGVILTLCQAFSKEYSDYKNQGRKLHPKNVTDIIDRTLGSLAILWIFW
jgi:hypothetical protein